MALCRLFKFARISTASGSSARSLKVNHIPSCRTLSLSSAQQNATTDNVALPNTLFTQDHDEMRRTLRKIIDKEINPYVDEWEAEGQYPAHTVMKKLGDAGLLGVNRDPAYGGLGLDYTYNTAMARELGNINCGAIPMSVGVQTDMATPSLARHGSELVKKEFLAPSIAGDKVSCLGVSEPGGGSDVASLRTVAVKQGDDYVINGSKMWITNAFQADWMCLLANTEGGAPPYFNKTMICLPMDTPGIHLTKKIDKLGMRSSDTAEIFFEDVRVPQAYRIGEEGFGFTYQMEQFQEERIFAAAVAIEPLHKLIQMTIDYTKQRKAFGAPLINNQVIHYRLAELETEVELLRSLIYRTVGLYVAGEDVTKYASMCKLKVGRLSRELTDSCLQYWGGMGFTNEVLVSRLYRDFRLVSIGGGADEVMLSIICKYMGTLPAMGKKKK